MNITTSQPLSYPTVGQRIRLRQPASVAPVSRGTAGLTGMVHAVVMAPGQELINVKMDQPLPDAGRRWFNEVWWNCLDWSNGAETLSTFLADCEFLPSFFPEVGQRIRLVREVCRPPYFQAPASMTGILTKVMLTPGAECIRAKMDQDLLSDYPDLQTYVDVELRNSIDWDDLNTIAAFFCDCALYPAIGQRIRLRQPVDHFNLFHLPTGLTGRVTEVNPTEGEDSVRVQMDLPLPDDPEMQARIEAEEQNCITWQYQVLPGQDNRAALDVFLADCEYIDVPEQVSLEYLPEPVLRSQKDEEMEGDLQSGDALEPVYNAQAILKGPHVQRWMRDVFGEASALAIADGLQALVNLTLATNPPWKTWLINQAPTLLFPVSNPVTGNELYYECTPSGSGLFVTIHRELPPIAHAHDESRQTAIAGLHIDYHLSTTTETVEQVKVQFNDEWTSPYGDHGWSTPGGFRYSDESVILVEDVQAHRGEQGGKGDA